MKLNSSLLSYALSGMIFLFLGILGAKVVSHFVKEVAAVEIARYLAGFWATWTWAAVLLGNDLTWHIRLEQALMFPLQRFPRLYVFIFLLGYLSFPVLITLGLLEYLSSLRIGPSVMRLIVVLAASLLFIASVRLTASLARTVMFRWKQLPRSLRAAAGLASIILAACSIAVFRYPWAGMAQPGWLFGQLISGERSLTSIAILGGGVLLLGIIDCKIQRFLTYSGIIGPFAPSSRAFSQGIFLLYGRSSQDSIFRISLLGWLRNKNFVFLFILGFGYFSLLTYFTRPERILELYLYISAIFVYIGAFRGNLLGMDCGAVWLYYSFPVPIEKAFSAKSLSLTLLQGLMIAPTLVTGLLMAKSKIVFDDGSQLISWVISSLLFGELLGAYFSLRYPEPIDRTDRHSGGTTPGALILPLIQILFLLIFAAAAFIAHRHLGAAAYWGLLLATPASMAAIRFILFPLWVRNIMISEKETIIKKLRAYPA